MNKNCDCRTKDQNDQIEELNLSSITEKPSSEESIVFQLAKKPGWRCSHKKDGYKNPPKLSDETKILDKKIATNGIENCAVDLVKSNTSISSTGSLKCYILAEKSNLYHASASHFKFDRTILEEAEKMAEVRSSQTLSRPVSNMFDLSCKSFNEHINGNTTLKQQVNKSRSFSPSDIDKETGLIKRGVSLLQSINISEIEDDEIIHQQSDPNL
ncbi:hypothetical protein SSS_00676 [Sarcoptes scabiei]|uniref:Uncharacterized protein n=1 Tax=Sarcoptes scabiei TaxID=52283 RepID=A0A834REV0_SARSC|nr:hypothetical protein SSS_00676 [Sarcoptes scabiei]